MIPAAIIQPFASHGPALEFAERPSEAVLRPVEPVTRARPRPDHQAEALAGQRRGAEPFQGHAERRRSVPATYWPARPQSDGFLAQVIAQSQTDPAGADPATRLSPETPARGSEAYRRAGAEPALYADEPAIYRIVA